MLDVTAEGRLDVCVHAASLLEQIGSLIYLQQQQSEYLLPALGKMTKLQPESLLCRDGSPLLRECCKNSQFP